MLKVDNITRLKESCSTNNVNVIILFIYLFLNIKRTSVSGEEESRPFLHNPLTLSFSLLPFVSPIFNFQLYPLCIFLNVFFLNNKI